MSLRVSVALTLTQADYLLSLVDYDLTHMERDAEDRGPAEGALRKIERAVNIVAAMRQKNGPK